MRANANAATNRVCSSERKGIDEFGTTIVITEQNANFAITLAERLYLLESGKIK